MKSTTVGRVVMLDGIGGRLHLWRKARTVLTRLRLPPKPLSITSPV